jgi:general secretion pathway protein J
MKYRPNPAQSGFSLVEMLVALGIFSLISVAGVALLQSASTTQLAVKERLSDLGGSARAAAMLESDLAQAVPRSVRSTSSNKIAAFASNGSETTGQLFAFTRMGWSNLDGAPRSELQRVAYALEGGKLQRIGWTMPDGGTPQPAILLNDVTLATARFRDAEGNWRPAWDASDALALPRAVELTVTQKGASPVIMMFLVGAGGAIRPVKAEQEGDNETPA